MIKVKFNNSKSFVSNVHYKTISEHVCKLIGNVPENTSGFMTYLPNEELLGDRSAYTTIYKVEPDGIMFSDDGSEWIDPVPEPFPMPEPIPFEPDPTPTLEERVSDLESAMIEIYEAMEV